MIYKAITEKKENDFIERIKQNNKLISTIDNDAAQRETLLHRFIYEPYADGFAVYQIIRVNKRTVRIRVCTGIGDDWVIPYWGIEATISLDYAQSHINRRDALKEIFTK